MATAREHIAADMAWLFAEDGEEVIDALINSLPVRAIVGDETTGQYDDGSWFNSRDIVILADNAAVTEVVPRQRLNLDGTDYLVDSVKRSVNLLFLTLIRTVA